MKSLFLPVLSRVIGVCHQLVGSRVVLIFFLLALFSCKEKHYPGPLTPDEALKAFTLDSNFTIEVFAAEPYVQDPVGLSWDEFGNAYVVELPDYPFPLVEGKASGKIKLLKDSNGDGKIDSAIVFADNLSYATNVLPWNGGLLVTAAPYIMYLKDTTGDGKADKSDTLFTGFFDKNTEAQITNLCFGVDNWIYANNMGFESKVREYDSKDTSKTVSLAGTDFRFHPDKLTFGRASGTAQFGQSIDGFGHRFYTSNSDHIKQSIIPYRYLQRNPFLLRNSGADDITDHGQDMYQITPTPYWRQVRTDRRNKKFKEQHLERVEYARDKFTGASGGVLYEAGVFPSDYQGNYFVTEVAGNLVHRDKLVVTDSLPMFVATLPDPKEKKEFLATTDSWFRPANISVGPDGSLYVIDMYRQHIETPFAIDEDLKKEMDFMAGSDKGRIYKIVPKNKNSQAPVKITSATTVADWIALLSHPNGFWQTRAQMKLLELKDKSIIPLLNELFTSSSNASARVRALYLLEAYNALQASQVQKALNDTDAGVRENAILLAEKFPAFKPVMIAKMKDPSARVAFQACLSAGDYTGSDVNSAFVELLQRYNFGKWFRTAVLTSKAAASLDFMKFVLSKDSGKQPEGITAFLKEFSYSVAARNAKGELTALLGFLTTDKGMNNQLLKAGLDGINNGLDSRSEKVTADAGLKSKIEELLIADHGDEVKQSVQKLKGLLQ